MPPARIAIVALVRGELRSTCRLPRSRQILTTGSSRASCFWTHSRVYQHVLRQPGPIRHRGGLGYRASFTTSHAWRSELKDESKERSRAISQSAKEQEQVGPNTISYFIQPLRSLTLQLYS